MIVTCARFVVAVRKPVAHHNAIMDYQFSAQISVRWKDVDSFQVVNNAVYFTMIEQTRFEYFEHLGLLRDGNFPFVVGETSCRYLQPARLGMQLKVQAAVLRLGNKSFEMNFEIYNGTQLLTQAKSTLVWVDEALKAADIPAGARQGISKFEGIPDHG